MLIAIVVFLGLCLGSFINALVWRLHEHEKGHRAKGKEQRKLSPQLSALSPSKDLSILHGRSMCPQCKHQLAAKDLVPVLSWMWLRGRCRYCRKPISPQYPLVELSMAALFVISYIFWPSTSHGLTLQNSALFSQASALFCFWLVFLVGLVALAVYDIKWQLLPNKIVYILMYVALVQGLLLIFAFHGDIKQTEQLALSFAIGGGLFYILFQVSDGKWIGGGDVKLGALLALILAQPNLIIFTIFGASLLGTVVSLPLLVTGKLTKSSRVPFGPLLIVAAIIARLFGQSLITWYKRHLGVA